MNEEASECLGKRAAEWQRTVELYYHACYAEIKPWRAGTVSDDLAKEHLSRACGARITMAKKKPTAHRQPWSDGGASWWSTLLSLMTEWAACAGRLEAMTESAKAPQWQQQRNRVCSQIGHWAAGATGLATEGSCRMPLGPSVGHRRRRQTMRKGSDGSWTCRHS